MMRNPIAMFNDSQLGDNPIACWWHITQCQGCGRLQLSYHTMWSNHAAKSQDCKDQKCQISFPRVVAAGVALKPEFGGAEK